MKSEILICDADLPLNDLLIKAHQNQGESGAVVTFTGAVRVSDNEQGLTGMTLEHYPGMTESQLQSILDEAGQRWTLNSASVAHRVGYLTPGQPIVFIATTSLHRKEAFEAAQFIMDFLKQKATFWKKEHYGEKSFWVEAKCSDEQAASRWK